MMNILVAYAVDPEFAPWRKLRKFQAAADGTPRIERTEIGGASVDFVVTGMGPERARRVAQAAMTQRYAVCLAAGFAGSLRAGLELGDVVIPARVRQRGGAGVIECDAPPANIPEGAKRIATLVSSDRIAVTAAEKAELAPLGDAVDMESYALLERARERGMAALAVRVISDRHDQDLPFDFSEALDENGQVSTGRILQMAAGNPGRIAALMRLGGESKRAAEALAKFLEAYLERLAVESAGGDLGRRAAQEG